MIPLLVKTLLNTRRLLETIILLGLFAMAMRPVTDPDVWWHLKTGELIATTHRVSHTDPFSYTRAGQPWVNHEWLSDWLIFSIYKSGGLAGLDAVFAVVVAAALFLVFLRSRGRPYLAGLFTIWGAVASAPSWGVRPQMLSLLLASVFLWILERTAIRPQTAWWMVPLMLLWVNLHAGYVLGILLIVVVMCGNIAEVVLGRGQWKEIRSQVRTLGLVAIACIAVVPLNPNGTKLYSYPFITLHSNAMQTYISEWFSPNFHEGKFAPFLLMLLATIVFIAISSRRLRVSHLLLLLITIWMALDAARHIPIFALVAIPILSELAEPILASGSTRKNSDRSSLHWFNYAVLIAFLIFTVVRIRTVVKMIPLEESINFPAGATRFLEKHALPGPLLNHYNWGGYVIWKLYPEYRVFIDGRADLYGDDFMNRFADLYYLKKSDWYVAFETYGIQTVMMPPDAPLIEGLRFKNDWEQQYADAQVVVLAKTPQEQPQASRLRP
jgi:hypothetical protein